MSEPVVLTPEMQQHFAMAFGEPLPNPAQNASPAPEAAPSAQPESAPASAQPEPTTNQPAAPAEQIEYFDPNEYLKQHLGFENFDTAKAEIERLRQQATTPAEHKFINEHTKRWYEYFTTEGKEDELREALNARHTVRGMDTMTDEQKIKLYIQMNNPKFDQELIDYQFQQDYGFDESQFKDENGVITNQLAYRHAKMVSLQNMQRDLSKANDFFNNYKTKIELPQIAQAAPTIDETYEGYKASTAKASEDYTKIIAPALQSLSDADLNMSFNVDDPNNQMKFDIGIVVDKQDFESAKDNSLYFRDWIEETFYDDKGVFQPKKLARAILLEANFDKYVQTIARQAVNAERQRIINKEAPSQTRRGLNVAPEVKSEIDKHMEMAFSV